MRIAENILNNHEDAMECVNDAYLVLWNKIPPEQPDPLVTYLLKVVRNTALKRYYKNSAIKRNNRYDTALHELDFMLSASPTPENESDYKELIKGINDFLTHTEKENRVIFVRRYFYSDNITDIADFLDRSPHFVSVRLSRTREKLKNYLIKEDLL